MNAHMDTAAQAASDGPFDAEELFALARVDLKKGDIAQGLQRLKQATRAAKVPEGAFGACGQLYMQLELPDHAMRMLNRHLELHPGAPDETFFLGSIHFRAGRPAEALKLWDEVLATYPSYVPALLNRAIALSQQGKGGSARGDLERVLRLAPVDSPYFKPARELMEHLDAQRPAAAATLPPTYPAAALAGQAYRADAAN